jgi:hypothetical protein
MRPVRITIATIYTAVILVSASWAQAPVLSSSPLGDDQVSVYEGFLNRFSSLKIRNLSSVTIPFDFKGFPDGRPCLNGIELDNASESLRMTHTLDQQITKGLDITLVGSAEREKLRKAGDALRASQKRTPSGNGQKVSSDSSYFVLSEIVFDTTRQFALLKYLIVCGQRCVSGAILVMEKRDGKWTTSSRHACAVFLGALSAQHDTPD